MIKVMTLTQGSMSKLLFDQCKLACSAFKARKGGWMDPSMDK
jgi:hypothetical protein